jgi:2-polyprenyl-3-methyl-5-hydroxy-6-metoxy-1,4-benzoquinol methylase
MYIQKDVFGQGLLKQYKDLSDTVYEIIERDDGFIEAAEIKRYFTKPNEFSTSEKKILNMAKGRVLDVGCGAGRHAIYLQQKGLDVTGIDNSPGAIKVSKLRGLKKTKLLPIEDVDKFNENSFDTVIMMGNNFGLFGTPTKAKQLLKKFYKVVSPNGQIIAENFDPHKTKNPVHLAYHKKNKQQGKLAGEITMRLRHSINTGGWFQYLFVSIPELKEIVKDTGWKVDKIIKTTDSGYIAILKK